MDQERGIYYTTHKLQVGKQLRTVINFVNEPNLCAKVPRAGRQNQGIFFLKSIMIYMYAMYAICDQRAVRK